MVNGVRALAERENQEWLWDSGSLRREAAASCAGLDSRDPRRRGNDVAAQAAIAVPVGMLGWTPIARRDSPVAGDVRLERSCLPS